MKSNREMFYPGMMNPMMPGMTGMPGMGMPSTGMGPQMGMPSTGMGPQAGMPSTGMPNNQWIQGYNTASVQDFERRIDMLERQVKRLDTRISRLETPYAGGPMGQQYSTSVPSQDFMSTTSPSTMHMM